MSNSTRIIVLDTSLRDGAQSPGIRMDSATKIAIAQALDDLGVDYIEAGFPVSSQSAFEAVQHICKHVKHARIATLARCNALDIERAAQSMEGAAQEGRLHTFISTSPVHMEKKLKMSPSQVLDAIGEYVRLAKKYCSDVQFSAEDAVRSDPAFLQQALAIAIEAGASTINLPDTVGYALPHEYAAFMQQMMQNVPKHITFSAHCHDDLGLAVANSLAALQAGARQVECTINGIGERAGNAALEEIVMAVHTRMPSFHTNIHTPDLFYVSSLVQRLTGFHCPPNKAIVGANAFAHESGIHQDGVLKDRATYEIMSPQTVGWVGQSLVLGKTSGRAALQEFIFRSFGVRIPISATLFDAFKSYAEEEQTIQESDLKAFLTPYVQG